MEGIAALTPPTQIHVLEHHSSGLDRQGTTPIPLAPCSKPILALWPGSDAVPPPRTPAQYGAAEWDSWQGKSLLTP